MTIQQQLDAAISKWNLLNHPFYQAWSNGTLPVEKLKTYSAEYASFIQTIAAGWEAVGNADVATEEREHYILWQDFARSLGNVTVSHSLDAVDELVATCSANNNTLATALGGLYAFEAQQPYTSQSKLKGLRTHYATLSCDETYFKIHENDFDEPAMLVADLEKLNSAEQQQAVAACEAVAEKLWNTLSAIHGEAVMC